MIAHKAAAQTFDSQEITALPQKRGPRIRKALAGALLAAAVAAALAAGGWGVVSAQVPQPAAAAGDAVPQGEVAEVPGGLLRVDDVIPEHMAPMQMGKFAQSGMNMSGASMDMTPEGQQRFTVEVSLAAVDDGLDYSAEDFRLIGEGVEDASPVRSQLGDGTLPAGSETHGAVILQAPEDTKDLMLSFDGGEPVALELGGSGSAGDKSAPSGGSSDNEGGHGH